jgi:hypothetical protein
MGRRLAIPRILGVDWWWIFALSVLEGYARHVFHMPDWTPSLWEVWMLSQMLWLKRAEPSDIAIYFFALWLGAYEIFCAVPALQRLSPWKALPFLLIVFSLQIASIFIFRAGMEKHFTKTEPRSLRLHGGMTFWFSLLYFQYWFHQLYLEQNAPELPLTDADNF